MHEVARVKMGTPAGSADASYREHGHVTVLTIDLVDLCLGGVLGAPLLTALAVLAVASANALLRIDLTQKASVQVACLCIGTVVLLSLAIVPVLNSLRL